MENYPAYAPVVEAKKPSKGFGIAALITGIYGLVMGSIPAAIAAIILGTISQNKNPDYNLGKTGKTLGIIGLIVSIVVWVALIILYIFYYGMLLAMLGL